MATIFSLPPYLIDRIYIHIHDRESIQALFGTSLYFQRHVKENERYRRVAEYTAACYEVVATNLDHEPMWFRLKHAKVIQIGEHHNIEWERVVFAHLLHGIWHNRRDSLLIEHEPYFCRGQIRFVHPAIASQAVCWDISSAEKEALKYIKCMDTAFAISQKTLLAYDERRPSAFLSAFSQLNEILYAYYPGIPHFMLQKPYQEYLKEHFAHRRSRKALNEKRIILMLQTYQVALAAVDHYFYFGTLSLYEDSIQRDYKFVSEIFNQIQKKGKKRVITMSGTAHSMKGGYVHSQLERYGLPYLSLIGKGALRQELSHKKGVFSIDRSCFSLMEKRRLIREFHGSVIYKKYFYSLHIARDVLLADLEALICKLQRARASNLLKREKMQIRQYRPATQKSLKVQVQK